MEIEEFIREHMTDGKKDFVLHVAIDPNTSKIIAKFDDDQPDGGVANCRIEGNQLILQSFDTAQQKRVAAEAAKEEAARLKFLSDEAAAKAAAADADAKASGA